MAKKKSLSRDIWEMHIWKWSNSSLSITNYCTENSLSRQSFYKWKGIFHDKTPEKRVIEHPKKEEFIPVEVAPSKTLSNSGQIKLSFTSNDGQIFSLESSDMNMMMKLCQFLQGAR
ncbi:MAG: hypothetical protein AB8G05_12275 [Oligoflexales bacterium]